MRVNMKSSAGHLYLSLKPFDSCGNNLNSGFKSSCKFFEFLYVVMENVLGYQRIIRFRNGKYMHGFSGCEITLLGRRYFAVPRSMRMPPSPHPST